MGWRNERLCVGSKLHDEDGHHAIYGKNLFKSFFSGLKGR